MVSCRHLGFLAASFALSAAGCREAKIASYRVPKEPEPAMELPAATAAPREQATLRWTAPASWKEQSRSGVRLGSFAVSSAEGKTADMAVTRFPGDVGGDLANVNRWRSQVQLEPIAADELSRTVQALDLPAGRFSWIEITAETAAEGKEKQQILGAWLKQTGQTWFFKLMGDASVVTAERENFLAFLRSVTPANENAPSSPVATNKEPASAGQLEWTAPSEWIAKEPVPPRKGSFTLRAADGSEADLSIISFPGEAGGLVENLNRWRNQLQLPPMSATELGSTSTTAAKGDLRFTIVDYAGTTAKGKTRIVGGVLPLSSETYFFKLQGPDTAVGEHKAAFLEFLQTVRLR